MEIKGKVILALPEVSGTSQSSGKAWKKREYVLETHDSFPKKVHFDFFGDRADQYPLNPGDEITLSFDIESREYQGRWYTSIRGWKAEKDGATFPQAAATQAPPTENIPTPPPTPAGENDDLPF